MVKMLIHEYLRSVLYNTCLVYFQVYIWNRII